MKFTTVRNLNAVLCIRPALIAATSIYLVVPSLIFIYFWFRQEIAVIAVSLGIILGSYHVAKSARQPLHLYIRPSDLVILMFVAALVVYFSGIGGFSIQSFDYWGHNAKLFELSNQPWPVSYKEAGTFACYYYGYYLVPALLYQFFQGHLNLLAVGWAGLGIYLIVVWCFILFGHRLLALSFFLFGGIPHLLLNALPFYDGVIIQQCKLYFLGFMQALLWQPHQCIPAALLAALIIHSVSAHLRYSLVFFLACSCIAWGPFVFMGSSGVVFLTFAREWFGSKNALVFSRYWSGTDVLSLVYVSPLLIYFMSSSNTSGLHTIMQSGALWPLCYAAFLLANLSFFVFLINVSGKSDNPMPYLLTAVFTFLCIVSFFKMGVYNDLVCKASMPALCIIYFETARIFTERRRLALRPRYLVIMHIFMFISVVSTMDIMKRQFEYNSLTKSLLGQGFPVIPYDTYRNSYEMLKAKYSEAEASQYLGNINSVYKKYLSPR